LRDAYAEQTRDDASGYVDDRTWNDLGMNEVHARVDTCFTIAGRNELIRSLRHVLPDRDVRNRRMDLMDELANDNRLREKAAVALARVGEERDADPARLLWSDSVGPDKLAPVSVGLALMAALFIVIAAAWNLSLGLIGVAVSFFTNMIFYYTKARHLSTYIPALRVLVRMIEAARELPWQGLGDLPGKVAAAKRASNWLLTGAPSPSPTLSGDITEAILLYIKIYFQIDLIAFNRIAATIVKHRDVFQEIYHGVGQVDAVLALASYRARRKRTCSAIIVDPENGAADAPMSIELDHAYHPLISKAVSNSVTLSAPGAIVTGTNMAGKSTFLRTVGINVLFAQTAGYAFARGYEAPVFRVMSSIEKGDDLEKGKSFYYDEAERIYLMIEQTKEAEPLLLLIDELLSGTNSLERESASVAILHYLAGHNALTVAATHDVAIARGVADQYALHYFTDSADENGLTFDFKIHDGVVESRNAIKLLRLIGYPEDVIRRALE
jgi:DNA mismatch repair ATPase MutS